MESRLLGNMELPLAGESNMSETSKIASAVGAKELKKVCTSLLKPAETSKLESSLQYKTAITKNISSPIIIERSGDIVTVAKCSDKSTYEAVDFQFKFRLSFVENKCEWWPIYFHDNTGRTIEAETKLGNKVLTNVQKQNELIELANTWAKSIASQELTRTIDGLI